MALNNFTYLYRKIPGTFLLRLTLGGTFFYHGIAKVMNMDAVIQSFANMGFSPLIAWMVMLVQLIGGAFIFLGIFVRISSLALGIIMLGTIFFVKWGQPFTDMELNVVLAGLSLGMAALGAGKWSACALGHKDTCKSGKCNPDGSCSCDCSHCK